MKTDPAQFLSKHTPLAEETAVWPWQDQQMPIRIRAYAGRELPPLDYVGSVRALLFRDDQIMVIRDIWDHYHIVPGGRREDGESLMETLRREILEETGWTLRDSKVLGFLHFYHLSPKPEGFPHHHPDFFQPVYMAQADQFLPHAQITNDIEAEAVFRPIAEARTLITDANLLQLLALALTREVS